MINEGDWDVKTRSLLGFLGSSTKKFGCNCALGFLFMFHWIELKKKNKKASIKVVSVNLLTGQESERFRMWSFASPSLFFWSSPFSSEKWKETIPSFALLILIQSQWPEPSFSRGMRTSSLLPSSIPNKVRSTLSFVLPHGFLLFGSWSKTFQAKSSNFSNFDIFFCSLCTEGEVVKSRAQLIERKIEALESLTSKVCALFFIRCSSFQGSCFGFWLA